jgi:hypothetical protein
MLASPDRRLLLCVDFVHHVNTRLSPAFCLRSGGTVMQLSWSAVSSFAIALIAFSTLSCGSHPSSLMGPVSPNGMQSITLAPSSADARTYPGGQVPFTATGSYIDPVRKLTPQPASWGVCQQNAPTTEVTVSKTGVANVAWERPARTRCLHLSVPSAMSSTSVGEDARSLGPRS